MNYFFDIGANIGQTFDWFLAKTNEYDGWTVWCFEPSPRYMAGLICTAARFRSRYRIAFAVSGADGLAGFYEKLDPLAFRVFGYEPMAVELADVTPEKLAAGFALHCGHCGYARVGPKKGYLEPMTKSWVAAAAAYKTRPKA